MRKESRGLERERYVANFLCHTAFCGRAVAAVVSLEDASRGSDPSDSSPGLSAGLCAAFFCCHLRRWGATFSSTAVASVFAMDPASPDSVPAELRS